MEAVVEVGSGGFTVPENSRKWLLVFRILRMRCLSIIIDALTSQLPLN